MKHFQVDKKKDEEKAEDKKEDSEIKKEEDAEATKSKPAETAKDRLIKDGQLQVALLKTSHEAARVGRFERILHKKDYPGMFLDHTGY